MAASGEDAMPPIPEFHMDIPPIPQPADIPPPSPCLDSLSPVCQGVSTKDSPNLAPCCTVFKKLFNNDPTCVCDAVVQAQKVAKQYKLNGTMYDGLETFRLCDMPTTSCEPGKPELLMVTSSDKGPITKQELTIDKTNIGEGIGSNVATRRKMVSGDAVMEKTEGKDARTIPSSGAKHPVGKCGHEGRKDLSVSCYFSSRKLPPGVYFDGHIPFTADYPKPEHHHPKNN
ncbi:hypothetical protein ACQ4PT_035700 [Festuca glaucescens]